MSLTAKLALSPVLVVQALRVRRRAPRLPEAEGTRQGVAGRGAPVGLLVLGDSSAAGVGVAAQNQALAEPVARALAQATGSAVRWTLLARSGVTSAQALTLLGEHPGLTADLAVVVTGVNDVVDQVPSQRAVAHRDALANHLRNACGVQHVVFVPLPPVGQFPALPQPLRWVAGADARRHNLALARWAAQRRDVSVPEMPLQAGHEVMADDGFHPGAPAYREIASRVATHLAQQVWPTLEFSSPAPPRRRSWAA